MSVPQTLAKRGKMESGGELLSAGLQTPGGVETEAPDGGISTRHGIRGVQWRGLLWVEWYAHSKLLLVFLGLWLTGVWVMPLFAHPGWVLLLGGLYALLAGPVYGGSDVLEGCEEFTFSLPATRAERYLARLAVGGGTLLGLTIINWIVLGLDLPQVLAGLYVRTGLISPVPLASPGLLYGLIAALPFSVFSFSFAASAITHSRWLVLSAWFWSLLVSLAILQLGSWAEEYVWGRSTGFVSCPLLVVAGSVVLAAGGRRYREKEIGEPSAPIELPGRWWLWFVLFLIGALLAWSMVASLVRHYSG